MKKNIPLVREREGNEKKNIPKIREQEGNKKIQERESGAFILGSGWEREFPLTPEWERTLLQFHKIPLSQETTYLS